MSKNNKTHEASNESVLEIVEGLKKSIALRGDLAYVSVKRQLDILDDLSSFPLGRFFIERKGADGFWTDYIINYPQAGAITGLNSEGSPFSPVERFILEKSPLTLATRERFKIFQTQTQKCLRNDIEIASIPCGFMRDLLSLDYSHLSSISIVGIDLDPKSLRLAKQLALEHSLTDHIQLFQKDAWNLPFKNQIDLITSNGLNVYISEAEKRMQLYQGFHRALKKGGVLIVGVLTYPPGSSKESEWVLEKISDEDLLMEKVLFQDVLGCKWRNFRTLDEIYEDFYSAGFTKVRVIFDQYHIFPTVIANK